MRKTPSSLVELLHVNGWRIHFKAALRIGLLKKAAQFVSRSYSGNE
jgi:hypothetical protein